MYPAVSIDNESQFTCYGCGMAVKGVDLFVLSGLSYPNDYLCSNCLVARLRDNTLTLTITSEAESSECPSCGEGTSDDRYCGSCYDNRYSEGMDDATSTCNDCGTDDSVYCYSCAKNNWGMTDEASECMSCSAGADYLFCEDHMAEHDDDIREEVRSTEVVNARAADGIEVDWGG